MIKNYFSWCYLLKIISIPLQYFENLEETNGKCWSKKSWSRLFPLTSTTNSSSLYTKLEL